MANKLLRVRTSGYVIFMTMTFVAVGCKSKQEAEFLRNCVEKEANRYVSEIYGPDSTSYLTMLDSFEELLKAKRLLKDESQESYVNLMSKIISHDPEVAQFYNDHQEKVRDLSLISSLALQQTMFNCPFEMVKTDSVRLYSIWEPRFRSAEGFISSGLKNINTFKSYVQSFTAEDFADIAYRNPIIASVIIHMERGYNREIEYRDSVKIFGNL